MTAPELLLSTMAVIRVLAVTLGISHLIGYFAFARYYTPWIVAPGVVLIIMALPPYPWSRGRAYLVLGMGCLAGMSYSMIGLPFFDVSFDASARVLLFIEFFVIATLVLFAAIASISKRESEEGAQ